MKTKLASIERIKTSDPVQTAYFLAKGYQLLSCDVEEVPHIIFTVEGRALERESNKFHSHETRVEPLKFHDELGFIQEATLMALEKYNYQQRKKNAEGHPNANN